MAKIKTNNHRVLLTSALAKYKGAIIVTQCKCRHLQYVIKNRPSIAIHTLCGAEKTEEYLDAHLTKFQRKKRKPKSTKRRKKVTIWTQKEYAMALQYRLTHEIEKSVTAPPLSQKKVETQQTATNLLATKMDQRKKLQLLIEQIRNTLGTESYLYGHLEHKILALIIKHRISGLLRTSSIQEEDIPLLLDKVLQLKLARNIRTTGKKKLTALIVEVADAWHLEQQERLTGS
ncbi:MAG: hypothetical protein Q4B28_07005 [bacterium]|nr:hypothetical protein [bacterium]